VHLSRADAVRLRGQAKKEGRALAESCTVPAMMDNSNGLGLSLSDLSEVSRVGFVVKEETLPVAKGLVEMVGHERAVEMVMNAGGDSSLSLR
jgi:thiamine-monophosphate kinase